MAEFRGRIRVAPRAPFVYFILKGRYAYIGETQQLVIHRWADHFSENGSFRSALRQADPELLDRDDDVTFFVFYCEEIHKKCSVAKMRRTTQFLEHLLHVRTITHPQLGPRYVLISDTKRTAPSSCDLECIDNIAARIIDQLAAQLCT